MLLAAALLLTVCTGFSGLVYEVTWQRYLATLLGSHSEATAAVLAIFLGGLALGYETFGAVTRRMIAGGREGALLVAYACVEAAIGAWALVFPWTFSAAQRLSGAVSPHSEALAFAFDLGLTVLLLGPPTVAMGGTIPMLTQALTSRLEDATRVHAWVYATNTLGAFFGALAAAFVVLPQLGLDGAVRAMGVVNIGAAFGFAALHVLRRSPAVTAARGGADAPAVRGFAAYALTALLAGFAMMALQTLFNRIGGLAFGSSHFTFAMVVAVFVLSIALGSFAVAALARVPRGLLVFTQWALVAILLGLYPLVPDAGYAAHVLRATLRDIPQNWLFYQGLTFVGILGILVIPVALGGALLPLLFHHLRRQVGDLGQVAGRLYAWNTLGSLLGALLGGYALLFWLDLHHVYRISVALLAVGAAVLSVVVLRMPSLWAALALGAVFFQLGVGFEPWSADRLSLGFFRNRLPTAFTFRGADIMFENTKKQPLVFHVDDPIATVGVKETELPGGRSSRSIINNGKSDGDLVNDRPTMTLLALAPALLADQIESAFVVGFGTGVTAGELGSLESVKEVVVTEISPGVVQAAPLFEYGNLGALANEKIRIVRSDAYRALLRTESRFDVIVSEPSNPWVTGVEMLYSREFLEAARARLRPGGVYAQWFHLYETDRRTLALVLRTYASVFPRVAVWYTMGPDIMLLGFDGAGVPLELGRVAERFARPDFEAGFGRVQITRLEELLAHELVPEGVIHAARLEGPVHTLRRPILSDRAARGFFTGKSVAFPPFFDPAVAEVGARNSLLARYLMSPGAPPADEALAAAAAEACRRSMNRECATLMARARWAKPGSEAVANALARMRKSRPRIKELRPATLSAIERLFGGAALPPGPVTADQTLRTTRLFARFHHAAFPFDRGAIRNLWARCSEAGEACARSRRQAVKILGGLGGD